VFGTGSRSSNREAVALVVMSFVALGILAYWGLMRLSSKMTRDAKKQGRYVEDVPERDPSDPIWQQVAARRERDRAIREGGRPGEEPGKPAEGERQPATTGETSGIGAESPALAPWEGRKGDEIPRDDAEWIAEAERKVEAERAKFQPMLDAFKPLEPDAVQEYRIRIEERVAAGDRPKIRLPGAGDAAERPVVNVSKKGLTLELAGGERREVAWKDVPEESFYRLARQVAVTEGPAASARSLLYLAQLADIAGEGKDASGLRTRAARVHFRKRLTESAAEARPSFSLDGQRYSATGATTTGLSAQTPDGQKRTFAWKDVPAAALRELARGLESPAEAKGRALDLLHLSRVAAEAGGSSEAAELEQKALAADPLLADEIKGRLAISLNGQILDEYSWAWDPADLTALQLRDAEKISRDANNLTDDAPSVFHVYRYMRTLGPRRVAEVARRNPNYMKLLYRPRGNRGRVFKIRGGFIRRYKRIEWTKVPEHTDAGVRDLEFCFLRDTEERAGIYLVSVPRDTRSFKSSDFVSVTGVYVRRWPYQKPNGRWRWIPWIAGMSVRKIDIPPPKGWGAFIFVLLAAGLAGGVILFLAARREWRDGMAARDRLHARRRGGRDRVRRKVAEAMRASDGAAGKSGDDSSTPPGEDAKAGPGEPS
jgi:hypothetical protein